jgi:hypothetical protein
MTRTLRKMFALALVAALTLAAVPASAQSVVFLREQVSVAGAVSATTGATSAPCVLVKYVGSTAGKPTVEAAAGGDVTFKIATVADATIGSPNLDGIFDLSTPAAAVDTMGEFVNLINTTGSNWRAVLVGCLASDLTDNAIFTLAATDAATPVGVPLYREATSASATSVFSAQTVLLPDNAHTNIAFFLSGSKVNTNPLNDYQTFVQHIRERITSAGTVALFEVLGVKRTYDSNGKVSETVRTLYAETGANTTVEKTVNFHNGPIPASPGEFVMVRQRTGTDLTAISLNGSGYAVRRQK